MPLTAHPPTAVRRSSLPHAASRRLAGTDAPGTRLLVDTHAPAPGATGARASSAAGADRLAGSHAPGTADADPLVGSRASGAADARPPAGSDASGAAHRPAGTRAPAHPAAVGWLAQVPALDAYAHGLAVGSRRRASSCGGVCLCRVGRLG